MNIQAECMSIIDTVLSVLGAEQRVYPEPVPVRSGFGLGLGRVAQWALGLKECVQI